MDIHKSCSWIGLIFLIGSLAAPIVQATSIHESKHLKNKEKDYLFAVVELLRKEDSDALWRKHFNDLKVPATFRSFHKALLAAIDFQPKPSSTPILRGSHADQFYREAYDELRENCSDTAVLSEFHDLLYARGGTTCMGGPCW